MATLFANNAISTLASGITDVATSLTVATGEGALFPSPGSDTFLVTLTNAANTVHEIVQVTARTTDTFTIVRGQDGTTAVAWNSGDFVQMRITAGMLGDFGQLGRAQTWTEKQTISTDGTNDIGLSIISADATSFMDFQDSSTTVAGNVRVGANGDNLVMWAGGSEHLRLNSNGKTRFFGQLLGNVGSTGTPGYGFDGDGNTGITQNGADSLRFVTGGTVALDIDASQNASFAGTVAATGAVISTTGDTVLRVTAANGFGAFVDLGDAAAPTAGRINYDTAHNLSFYTNSSERLRIESSGRVGINTSSPNYRLQVNGSVATVDSFFYVTSTTNSATGLLRVVDSGGNNAGQLAVSGLDGLGANASWNFQNSIGDINFQNSGNINMNCGGNVGIGTSSPAFTYGGGLEIQQAGDATLRLERSGATASAVEFTARSGIVELDVRTASDLSFRTSATERLRIDSSGNVGIGTTSPSRTLDVDGSIGVHAPGTTTEYVLLNTDANNSYFSLIDSGGTSVYFDTTSADNYISNGNVGIGTSSPSTKLHVAGGGYFTSNLGVGVASPTAALEVNGQARVNNGIASVPSFGFRNDTDTGMFLATTGELGFSTAGSERLRIDSSGNVGIGTTSPGAALDVNGTILAGGSEVLVETDRTALQGIIANRAFNHAYNDSNIIQGVSVFSTNGDTGYPYAFGAVLTASADTTHNRQFQLLGGDDGDFWYRRGHVGNTGGDGTGWDAWAKIWTDQTDGAGSGLDADTVDGIEAVRIVYGDNASGTNDEPADDLNAIVKSGFWQATGAGAHNGPTSSSWTWVMHHEHTGLNGYGFQLAVPINATQLFLRRQDNNVWSDWKRLWNEYEPIYGDGTVSLPYYSFNSDTDSGMFLASAGQVGISIGGVGDFRFASSYLSIANSGVHSTSSGLLLQESGGTAYIRNRNSGSLYLGTNEYNFIQIRENGTTWETIMSAQAGEDVALYFGDATDPIRGGFIYDTSANILQFQGYNNTTVMRMGGDYLQLGANADEHNLNIHSAAGKGIVFYNAGSQMGDITAQDTTWLRINQNTAKNIYTPRMIRADGGFFIDGGTYGFTGSSYVRANDSGAASSPTISFGGDTNTGMYRYSSDTIGFATAGVNRGYWNSTSLYANNFTLTSDVRTKTRIRDLKYGLAEIMQLRPIMYDRKDGTRKDEIGLISQEVEKIMPELVVEGDPGEDCEYVVKHLDYQRIVAPLINAIAELKEEIDELRDQLDHQ